MDLLQVARDTRGVVTLTLNDPARFNALGSEMLTLLQQALDDAGRDGSVRVVVISAAGKAFCAGHNLKDMAAHPQMAYYQKLFAQCSRMMLTIHKLPVPVIARVQGMATAAGCQLVAQCDLAVASEDASFATSGTLGVEQNRP
jgi:enoyl-CoA hydratase/carnithine racemase